MGSVRGMFSILICSFFWILLLLPGEVEPPKTMLAHFFMLGLVIMAFATSPVIGDRGRATTDILPWFFRVIFVGVTAGVVVFSIVRDVNQLQIRLTPDPSEINEWWVPFLGCMAGGFLFGVFLRFVLGRENHVFLSLRAWLSVVGMIILSVELAMFIGFVSAQIKPVDFLHYWQCVGLVVVSAYFGTRA
jgi:hypothetical protein